MANKNFTTKYGGSSVLLGHQALFNRAYKHALTMEEKSEEANGDCCYYREDLSGNVNMCLIGAVVGKKVAKKLSDLDAVANPVNALYYRFAKESVEGSFLNELQACHDATNNPDTFKRDMIKSLRLFASSYDLKIPDVQSN